MFLNSPDMLLPDMQIQATLLENSYYFLFKNVWAMKEYMSKVLQGMALTSNTTKRKKLFDQMCNVQEAWTAMVLLAFGISV
jgi:hypothetical protein